MINIVNVFIPYDAYNHLMIKLISLSLSGHAREKDNCRN